MTCVLPPETYKTTGFLQLWVRSKYTKIVNILAHYFTRIYCYVSNINILRRNSAHLYVCNTVIHSDQGFVPDEAKHSCTNSTWSQWTTHARPLRVAYAVDVSRWYIGFIQCLQYIHNDIIWYVSMCCMGNLSCYDWYVHIEPMRLHAAGGAMRSPCNAIRYDWCI